MRNICSVEGCDRSCVGRGLCSIHYQRFMRYGDTGISLYERGITSCSVEGCMNKYFCKGFCNIHFMRHKRYGDTDVVKSSHGEKRTFNRLYKTFQDINQRCYNENNPGYKNYGGRGIEVCEQWRGWRCFQQFVLDMGPRPEGTSIDRIDNDGNYCPENCRRATRHEQNSNKRNNNKTVGVSYNKQRDTRKAEITINKNRVLCKSFKTEQEAIDAVKEAESIYL